MADFLKNGGQVAWALDCMIRGVEEEPNVEEDEVLPKCKNDKFVRRMIGLDVKSADDEREEFGDDFSLARGRMAMTIMDDENIELFKRL
ncbi:hypothetical protein BDZ89DRAFT_1076965 [Hymenopellis radicata]|nr:hypothetical protein BDZ89DRAFT_1076965 [Hymenopellis radicata]